MKLVRKVAPHMITPNRDKRSINHPMIRPSSGTEKRTRKVSTPAEVQTEFARRFPTFKHPTPQVLTLDEAQSRLAACLKTDGTALLGYRGRVAALRRMIGFLKSHAPATPEIAGKTATS